VAALDYRKAEGRARNLARSCENELRGMVVASGLGEVPGTTPAVS